MMIAREEVIKLVGAILNPACGGFEISKFRREYRHKTGVEFPFKVITVRRPEFYLVPLAGQNSYFPSRRNEWTQVLL